jgi:hypothetical protein
LPRLNARRRSHTNPTIIRAKAPQAVSVAIGAMTAAGGEAFSASVHLVPHQSAASEDAERILLTAQRLLGLLFREKFLSVGKAIRLEEEAENYSTIGGHRLVLVSGWAPNKLTRPAYTFVILERAFEDKGLL